MSHAENGSKMPRRGRMGGTVLIALMFIVGPVLIGIGASVTAAEDELARTGTHVEGTVTTVRDGVKASRQRFEVEYLDADASAHSVWVSWSTAEKPVEGDTVTVVYSSSNPDSAMVEGYDGDGISVSGVGVVLTLVFGVVGVVMLVSSFRGKAARKRAPA
jgi:hypothetical protein